MTTNRRRRKVVCGPLDFSSGLTAEVLAISKGNGMEVGDVRIGNVPCVKGLAGISGRGLPSTAVNPLNKFKAGSFNFTADILLKT